jgi:hypothetical protein
MFSTRSEEEYMTHRSRHVSGGMFAKSFEGVRQRARAGGVVPSGKVEVPMTVPVRVCFALLRGEAHV